MKRCKWVENQPDFYKKYHDEEWGIPEHNDIKLFELLILEGAQAGLSWSTILKKRTEYRKAFDNFDPNKVSKYNQEKINQLLQNEGIVRNKLKIHSAIKNAQVFLEIQKEFKSFNNYIWSFTENKTIAQIYKTKNELSDKISQDLKRRGMKFVGSTIIYSYLQAIGIINDHEKKCFKFSPK